MADYKGNAELYETVEDIPGEQAMFQKAVEIIMQHAKEHSKLNHQGIDLLDLCCGTSTIVRSLPLDENKLIKSVTEVDIDKAYLDFLEKKCDDITMDAHVCYYGCGAETKFILEDAVDYAHPTLADIIVASSAYHHIEDERKLRFLEKIKEQLKDDGIAVFCENLIGDYNTLAERAEAVTDFYAERLKQMSRLGITDKRLGLVCRVLQYELDGEYEWKHSYQKFRDNLQCAGLVIAHETKVWPSEDLFSNPKVGDFVFEVRKNA